MEVLIDLENKKVWIEKYAGILKWKRDLSGLKWKNGGYYFSIRINLFINIKNIDKKGKRVIRLEKDWIVEKIHGKCFNPWVGHFERWFCTHSTNKIWTH